MDGTEDELICEDSKTADDPESANIGNDASDARVANSNVDEIAREISEFEDN